MEVGNRFMEGTGRIIRQHPLEVSESHGTVVKIFFTFHHFKTYGVLYKKEHSPVIIIAVLVKTSALPGFYHV